MSKLLFGVDGKLKPIETSVTFRIRVFLIIGSGLDGELAMVASVCL